MTQLMVINWFCGRRVFDFKAIKLFKSIQHGVDIDQFAGVETPERGVIFDSTAVRCPVRKHLALVLPRHHMVSDHVVGVSVMSEEVEHSGAIRAIHGWFAHLLLHSESASRRTGKPMC